MPMQRILGPVWLLAALLAALAAPAPGTEPGDPLEPRLVWQGKQVNTLGAPSPDGRWLSFADRASGNLAVRDLHTGEVRFVTRKSEEQQGEFAYFSVVGPDSKQVAYAWFNEAGFYELRLAPIPAPGAAVSPPRTLYRNPEAGFVQPCAFSPDGKQILTLFFLKNNVSQIALVSAADGTMRPLRSLSWIYPKRMDFSPDGRFLIYDNNAERGAAERDIFLLAADGSAETRLLAGPANELFPLWSRAGEAVIFSSNRSGQAAIWSQPLAGGRAKGEPRLLAEGLGRFLLLGLTNAGELYLGRRRGGSQLLTVDFKSGSHRPALPQSKEETLSGAVSPDGSTIAYLLLTGAENYGLGSRAVGLYSIEQEVAKRLPVRLAHVEWLAWSPDGAKLLLAGSDRRARNGIFEYDLAGGLTHALHIDPQADVRGVEAAWSPDGKSIWFVRGGVALIRRDLESRKEEEILRPEPGVRVRLPAPSADGRRLAYALVHPHGGGDIFLLNQRKGSSTKLLTLPSGELTDLVWRPDGKELLVGTASAGGVRLWRVASNGDSIRSGPSIKGLSPGVRFSLDGRGLLAAVGQASEEIWVIDHATSPLGP